MKLKTVAVVALMVVIIGSYIVNKLTKDSSLDKETSIQESAEAYIKRRQDERAQAKENEKPPDKTKRNNVAPIILTIDGYDPASKEIIDPLNLWKNYETRTYAGKVRHGEKVILIKREGDGVFIETKSGIRGWITYFFIEGYDEEKSVNKENHRPLVSSKSSFIKKYSGSYTIMVPGYQGESSEAYALGPDGSAVWVYGYKSNGKLETQKKRGTWSATEGVITISILGNTGMITEEYKWRNGRFRFGDRYLKKNS